MLELIRQHWLLICSLLLAVITTLSLWPMEKLPDVPGSDKIHHYIAYGALMLPLALRRPQGWPWLALLFFAWSGAIELIQPYVNRYGEWADLAANGAGLLSGLLLAWLLNRLLQRR
ncbi:VanZ family protein [Mariprofundus erugo]|uniref:VanZ family protein n=1 Tax=Mariprofundus erugo TaxID=2528639 RepID=UPI0010FEC857|nr:VanZ family protein [Mariprofundus erugo]TLS77403.1 VanZ family protein [Mariprofundus erugo]